MDSLYGMKTFFRVIACSDRAEMTFPRVSKDLLMLAPSCNSLDLNNTLFLNKFKIKREINVWSWMTAPRTWLNDSLIPIDSSSSFFKLLSKFQNVRMKNGNQLLQDPKWSEWQQNYQSNTLCWHVCVCVCTLSRSPLVMAELQRSLPARSTRLILLVMLCSCSSPSTSSDWAKPHREGKKRADSSSTFFHVHFVFQQTRLTCDIQKKKESKGKKKRTEKMKRIGKTPYLCLGHDESEYRVRSGALVIHSCCGCGALLVA